MKGLILRSNIWTLKRRVPKRFAGVESRAVIWESLKTDSPSIAEQKAKQVWNAYLEAWEARLAGRDGDAEAQFRAAKNIADMRGFQFLVAEQVAQRPVEEIVARVEAIGEVNGTPDPVDASALLGGVDAPRFMLSELLDRVEEISRYDNRFKSAQQMRLWRSPRKRAIGNLIAALGADRPVEEITATEAHTFRKYWLKRLEAEGKDADTANKDFSNLSGMLKRYYEDLGVAYPPRPFAGISISDRHKKKARKKEVPVDWITERWFATGAFDGLNDEARDILLISVETGCRQSEIHDLPDTAFQLEADIPHLVIRNELDPETGARREIKNVHSTREVPLVGVALAAARRHPEGFPRYRDKRGYSALINKFLRHHDLVPEGVTAGGLRHTWEARLKKIGVQTDDRGELMGHSVAARRGREVYGDEMMLEARRDTIAEIALPVPDHLA